MTTKTRTIETQKTTTERQNELEAIFKNMDPELYREIRDAYQDAMGGLYVLQMALRKAAWHKNGALDGPEECVHNAIHAMQDVEINAWL